MDPVFFLSVSFPAVGFVLQQVWFCSICFSLGRFHPGSPPSPLVGRILVTFRTLLVEMGWFFFRCVSLECFLCFFVVFVKILGSFLYDFRILVRAVFLLTFCSDVFQTYVHIQNSGSSKNNGFLK